MTPPTAPFDVTRYDAGPCRDGRAVALLPMTTAAAAVMGPACAALDPWRRYGISAASLTTTFSLPSGGGAFRYQVLVDGVLAGVLIVLHPWLVGPYVQFLAVLPAYQGQRVGRAALSWFERQARASKQRNIWLCVTGFNAAARGFYRAQGWEDAALLPDLVQSGVDEVIMRKRLF